MGYCWTIKIQGNCKNILQRL